MKKRVTIGIILLLIISIIFVSFSLFKNKPKEKIVLNFEDGIKNLEKLEENELRKYGWLQIQGTLINVPILLGTNSDYSFGWISTRSIGMKTREVLVGHNVLNVSSTPMVNNSILSDFEDLMAFSYYDFAKDNMYVSFSENGENKIYVIYAVGFFDYGYDNSDGLNTDSEISDYIKMVKDNSIYKYDVDVNKDDNILTIKTCTRYFGVDEKQQFQIDVREVRENEEIVKYNVKKTKVYKELNLKDKYAENEEI